MPSLTAGLSLFRLCQVENWLGSVNSVSMTVSKDDQLVALVSILGPATISVKPSDPLTLTAEATLPRDTCPAAGAKSGNVILFQWTQVRPWEILC